MVIKLNEQKCTIYQSTKAYAEKKVQKLDRYFKGDAEAVVTFRIEKKQFRVELTVRADGTVFRSEETTTDMMASIDAAVSTMERQIRKNKTRLERRLRTDAFVRTAEEPQEEPAQDELTVIRTKSFPIKPMTVDEAILQMNLLNHSFFAFRDEGNGERFSVVYVRKDGGYGLIEDAG